MKEENRLPNKQALLNYLLKLGKVGETIEISVKKMDLRFTKNVQKKVEYKPIVSTKLKFLKSLEKDGVIKIDYTNKWKPKYTILKSSL